MDIVSATANPSPNVSVDCRCCSHSITQQKCRFLGSRDDAPRYPFVVVAIRRDLNLYRFGTDIEGRGSPEAQMAHVFR